MILDEDISIIQDSRKLVAERKRLMRRIYNYITYRYSQTGTLTDHIRFIYVGSDETNDPYFEVSIDSNTLQELEKIYSPMIPKEGCINGRGYHFKIVSKELKQKLKSISQQVFNDTIWFLNNKNYQISDYDIDFKVDRYWR